MINQVSLEISILSSLLIISVISWMSVRHSKSSNVKKMHFHMNSLIGSFFTIAGTVKFFEPFNSMFTHQIMLSNLPFPEIIRWIGQLSELLVGLLFIAIVVFRSRLSATTRNTIFLLLSFISLVIMAVAVVVHLHPNVPATVLPLQSKPPVLTVIVMLIIGLNVAVFKRCVEH